MQIDEMQLDDLYFTDSMPLVSLGSLCLVGTEQSGKTLEYWLNMA